MINFFCPLLEMFCPLFKHIAQFRSGKGVFQVRKRGVLCGVGGVMCTYISQKGVCNGWVRTGVVGGVLAKSDPIWVKRDPSGQFVRKVGKSALELGKKNSIMRVLHILDKLGRCVHGRSFYGLANKVLLRLVDGKKSGIVVLLSAAVCSAWM